MDNTELIRALRSAAATTGLDAYVELMQKAADALSAIRPIAAPVTDVKIDAAFDALGLIRESTTVKEVRQVLAGFAAGRAAGAEPAATITEQQALDMGAKGAAPTEAERLLFEAWMRGHCWLVAGDWDGRHYVHAKETGGDLHGGAMQTRRLWAAWRDRAALYTAPQPATEERTPMTPLQINSMMNNMGTYDGDYEDAIVRAVEKHHEIKGAMQ